jgi:DNA-binding NarL/FixJ family response regulator
MSSLVIVEDDKRFSVVLRKMLQQYGYTIDAYFYCANDFLDYINSTTKYPDLCLFDLELPDKSGLEIVKEIQDFLPLFNVLILTSFSDEDKVFEAIKAGASGYILKKELSYKLNDSIIEVINGGIVIEPILANKFLNYFKTFETITSEENKTEIVLEIDEEEVLLYLIQGFTYKEIALFTEKTARNVKYMLSKIYKKLGVKSKVEAISKAIKLGLVKI